MKKKKIIIAIIIILVLVGLGFLITNSTIITTKKERNEEKFNELLENISKTKSVVVYGGVSFSEEYIEYGKNKYKKYKTIDNEEVVREIIDILSEVKIYTGPIITKMPEYVIYLLDENNNELVHLTLDPFTSSIINTGLGNTKALYEIIERDKISYDCIMDLDAYIQTEKNELSSINAEEISKNPLNFSRIIVTNNGYIYALINTTDNKTIKDFDTYFKNNYKGYIKEELIDNFILYIYNGQNDLEIEKSNCVK